MYLAVAGLVVMAGQYGLRQVGERLTNTTDPKEYAIGGFIEPKEGTTNDPIPNAPTYTDGWLTKPLDFVPTAPNNHFAHITDYPDLPLGFKHSPAGYLIQFANEQQSCDAAYALKILAAVGFNQDNAIQNSCWKYRPYVDVTPAETFNFRFYERDEDGHNEVYMYMAWDYSRVWAKYGTSTPFYLARDPGDGRGDRKYKFQFTDITRNPENNSPDGGDISARKLVIMRIDGNDTRQTQVWANDIRGTCNPGYTQNDCWKIDYNTYRPFTYTYHDEGQMFYNSSGVAAPFRLLQQSEDRMIRAGIKTKHNALWCIPSKPTASYYIDPEIGTLAPEQLFMQNRSWTDGRDPESPAYPENGMVADLVTTEVLEGSFSVGSCQFRGDSSANQPFFYQLVYDKDNMAVATTKLTAQVNGNMTASQLTITVASTTDFARGSILSSDSTSMLGLTGTANVLSVDSSTQLTIGFMEQSINPVIISSTTLGQTAAVSVAAQTITIGVADTTNIYAGDKAKIAGISGNVIVSETTATSVTFTMSLQTTSIIPTGTAINFIKEVKLSMPKKLWDTPYMSRYFNNSTITDMRRYYCQTAFAADMTGETVEKKCFGYINLRTTDYVMLPMTVLSSSATMITS
jgi:hypothetical protein